MVYKRIVAGVALTMSTVLANAGPVIIDGTDANDHGSASGGVNIQGWEYMQRALENLAAAVNPGAAKVVVDLGTTSGQARNAINSAFNLSALAGAGGWTLVHVDGAANISAWLAGLSTSNTGILYLPTYGLSSGDLAFDEMQAINAGAASINTFVSGAGNPTTGGALFSMGESGTGEYGWLTTLIPGILPTDVGSGGIGTNMTLTAAGTAAFPGLTNADLSGADPWHGYFSGNLGGLSVLATAPDNQGVNRNVIIGGGAGTVIACGQPGTPPCPTPEPGTLPLAAVAGLAFALLAIRRRKPA